MLEEFEVGLLADNGDVALLRAHDHVVCVVRFVDRERYLIRLGSDLYGCVGDAAVHLVTVRRGQYEESV